MLMDLGTLGGIQVLTATTARVLAEAGYRVRVVTATGRRDAESMLERLGAGGGHASVDPVRVPGAVATRSLRYLYFSRMAAARLRGEPGELSMNMHGDVQFVPSDIAYFHQFNVDYVFRFGGVAKRAGLAPLWRARRRFIEGLRGRGTTVLVNSSWTGAEARTFWGIGGVRVLHPPVPNHDSLAALAGLTRERAVLTISRFSPDRLLENALHAAEGLPDVRFVIAGYVQDRAYFSRLVRSKPGNVLVLADISELDKRRLLAGARVYLNPTTAVEGFGMGVAEGMAAGLVPVAADKGGVLDFVPARYRFRSLEDVRGKVSDALTDWSEDRSRALSEALSSVCSPSAYRDGILDAVASVLARRGA